MCHRQLDCPCLNIRGFVILQGATEETLDSWTDLGVLFPEFDFFSHAEQFVLGAEEEDSQVCVCVCVCVCVSVCFSQEANRVSQKSLSCQLTHYNCNDKTSQTHPAQLGAPPETPT